MTTSTITRMGSAELRQLHVHRFAGLFRPLEGDERDRLRDSMQQGYDDASPIVVNAEGEIVDGRNRRDVAVDLDLADVPVLTREFGSDDDVGAYVVSVNLARRHLSTKERAELAARLVANGASVREAAKATGVSKSTAQRAATGTREKKASVPNGTSTKGTAADGKETGEEATPETAPGASTKTARNLAATFRIRDLPSTDKLTADDGPFQPIMIRIQGGKPALRLNGKNKLIPNCTLADVREAFTVHDHDMTKRQKAIEKTIRTEATLEAAERIDKENQENHATRDHEPSSS